MPQFVYKGKTRAGRLVEGTMSSSSRSTARNSLLNRGIRPLQIVELSGAKGAKGNHTNKMFYKDAKGNLQIQIFPDLPSPKELGLFTKQFSLMIENGVPLLQSLNLLKEQQKRKTFSEILDAVTIGIEKGSSLSEALGQYPSVFDSLYVAMIKTGEASGKLDVVLKQIVVYIDKSVRIKAQVRSAMVYPLLILVVAVLVVALLLLLVVPTFATQFSESGQPLPYLTQVVVSWSEFLQNQWWVIIAAFGGAYSFFNYGRKVPHIRSQMDAYVLKLPLFGELLIKVGISRFCSTLSTMLSSGVSILEALAICATSAGNKTIENAVMRVRAQISKGESFHEPLMKTGLFPKMVCSMVAVGEGTGTLDATLYKISLIYDEEVENAVKTLTSMIEPIMIVVIGSLVGFIAIAMYLPIFEMASTVIE
jgi:type IV pilus assembly protein PilC